MSALREMQFAVADAVIHPEGLGGALGLIADDGVRPEARLSIYRNNFSETLTHALAATYPVTERLVGTDYFRHIARQYIRSFPSLTGNVCDYGDDFGFFVAGLPSARHLPYLADVARLEWSWQEVFHEVVEAPLDIAGLGTVPSSRWADLQLRLNRASRLIASDHPILRIWQVNQPEYAGDPGVDLGEGGCHLLLLQRRLNVEIIRLSRGEYTLLEACSRGASLQSAYEVAAAQEPELDLGKFLSTHIALGTFAAADVTADAVEGFKAVELRHAHAA
jgi:hypothetical protein